MPPPTRTQTLEAYEEFATHVVNGDLPDWFYHVQTTVVLYPVIKQRGDSEDTHDCRPVGCGSVLRRAIARSVKALVRTEARRACEPVQLGQGTKAGTQVMGLQLQIHADLHPGHLFYKFDIRNAFNEVERSAIAEAVAQRAPILTRYMETELRPRSRIYCISKKRHQLQDFRSVRGGQQGALSAGLGFNLAVLPYFQRVDTAVAVTGGTARAICDDLIVAAPAATVYTEIERLTEDIGRDLGLVANREKASIFSPEGQHGDVPDGVRIGGLGRPGEAAGLGIIAGGVPIGDEVFVRNHIAEIVDTVSGEIENNHTLLHSENASDHAFHTVRLSDSHRLDYFTQVTDPETPGVREEYARYDNVLHRLLNRALGVSVGRPDDPNPSITNRRAHLAKRHGGMGIVRINDICLASFAGTVEMVIPRLPNRPLEAGGEEPGLAPHLEHVVGTGAGFALPFGRYATFLESGIRLGAAFERAWTVMREEAGADPRGVFAKAAVDAPGQPRPEDVRVTDDEDSPHLQRHCTRERQRARASGLNERMRELEVDDAIRMAWDNRGNGETWTTLPREETAYRPDEFCMAACIFLGLRNPTVESAIANGRTHFLDIPRRGRPGQRVRRQMDAYGQNLSVYGGAGNYRIGAHDAVKKECTDLAKLCRLNARMEARDLFVSAIPPPRRNEFMAAMRRNSRNRGGLAVDILVENMPTVGGRPRQQMFEVKIMGHREDKYGVASAMSAVAQREAEIPTEYEQRARQADLQYCGTRPGEVGPVTTRLRAMAPVRGLVVGAYGEQGRGVDVLIGDLAKHASAIPERYGCCHGAEQARGVIAGMLRDRIGRTALRAAARLRLVALEAITRGDPGNGPEYAAQNAHRVDAEWDRGQPDIRGLPAPAG